MRKLYLATGAFPYGKREKSFIEPELKYLVQHYDVTIISHAYPEELADEQNISVLDERIKVYHVDCKVTWMHKIIYGLKYFCDRDGWRELADILRSGGKILSRLYQSIGFYALAMIDYKEICRNKIIEQSDAVYYSYWYFYYCFSGILYRRKNPGLKLISRTHGFELYHDRYIGGRQPFKKIMDPELDKLVFASDFAKQYYMDCYSIADTRNKYPVCKLGVEKRIHEEKAKRKKPEQDFLLVSCSNVIDIKRIELIIEGLSLIKDDRIHWTHIGEGDKSEELQLLAKRVLSPNITWEFKGYLSNEEIHRFYSVNHVDCFITTSRTEGGCPVSIQEAMAYAIPVIGTSVGGITEMIKGNGILLSRDPEAEEIKDAIVRMLRSSDEERLKMSESSENIWRTEYNVKENVNKFIEVLNQL